MTNESGKSGLVKESRIFLFGLLPKIDWKNEFCQELTYQDECRSTWQEE